MAGRKFALRLTPVEGGCTIDYEGESYELRSDWKLGELIFHGTWNGEPVCLQIQRVGWRYRVIHWGTQVDVEVLTARARAPAVADAREAEAGPVALPALADAGAAGRALRSRPARK